jgi:hypothetical protein
MGILCAQEATEEFLQIPIGYWHAPERWLPPAAQDSLKNAKTDQSTKGAGAVQAAGATAPLAFVAITPCRVVDTRNGSGFTGAFGAPALAANVVRTIPIPTSACAVPASAAYSLNFTVVPPGPLGFLSAFPDTFQNTSVLNSLTGTIVANGAVIPAAADGSIKVLASNPTDLVIDINGYYVPLSSHNVLATAVSESNYVIAPVSGTGVNSGTHVAPSANTTITANYHVGAVAGCPACIEQVVVGIVGQPNAQGCLFNGQPGTGTTGTGTVTLTAPTTPGIYYIGVRADLQFNCTNALPGGNYDTNIASLTVF